MTFGRDERVPGGGVLVMMVAVPSAPTRLVEAVAAVGGRVVRRTDWDVPVGDDDHDVLMLDADGASDDAIADLLGRIDADARPVIVALAPAQIDRVATLMGPSVQLLCDPTPFDCMAALVVAAGQARAPAHVRSDDAARVAVMQAEIARIAGLLQRLAQDDGTGDHVADRPMAFAARPAEARVTAAEVRGAIRVRRLRDRFFADGLLEDPAWDMLLDLFAAELEDTQVSVSSLCIAAAVAPTTALRWIGRMTQEGLFVRHADSGDRRRVFLALSPRASDAMRGYVAAIRSAGFSLP